MPNRLSAVELKGAAVSILWVFVDMILAGQEKTLLTTNDLIDRTGYKSRSVVLDALRKLCAHGYLVSPGTLGQSGQQNWGLAESFPQLFHNQELSNLTEISEKLSTLQIKFTASPMLYGVVINNDSESIKQQHHTEPTLQIKYTALPWHERAQSLLARLNCWPNVARSVLEALHPDKGLAHLLGWIAYAHDDDNGVRNKVVIVTKNLISGLQPPQLYTPIPVHADCHRIEGVCDCADPEFYLPSEFDDLAFVEPERWGREGWLRSRWYCQTCLSFPCQCPQED